jgi:hypothetical protein
VVVDQRARAVRRASVLSGVGPDYVEFFISQLASVSSPGSK